MIIESKPCYIFDIEGIIGYDKKRIRLAKRRSERTSALSIELDVPYPYIVKLIGQLGKVANIVFCTSLSYSSQEVIGEWLLHYFGHVDLFLYQAIFDSSDQVTKFALLKQIRAHGFEPIMAFDDRKNIVDAWSSFGIPCVQI
jgi:hypothetical protein